MKGQQNVFKNIFGWIKKIIFWSITVVILFLFVLIILLQTPAFQNFIGEKVLTFVNTNTRQTAKFKNIRIKWFDFVEIKDLELYDYQENLMVGASSVKVDYQLSQLITGTKISFDRIELENAELHMIKYQDSLGLNLVEFIYDLNNLKPKKDSLAPTKPMELTIGEIHLDAFKFSYDNHFNDSLPEGLFDYGHFLLDIPIADIADFRVVSDTIEATIQSFQAFDQPTGLEVVEMSTQFRISSMGLEMDKLELTTANSYITDKVHLKYNGYDDLSYFNDSISLDVNLVESRISTRDIQYFAQIPGEVIDVYTDASIQGKVPNLSIQDLSLRFGKKTMLKGSVDFMGLPNIYETFINASISDAELYVPDFEVFLDVQSLTKLENLDDIRFNGHFLGFIRDFVANGNFKTDLGELSSDVNLKFSEGWRTANYSGDLRLKEFDIGELLNISKYAGKLNMVGSLRGSGVNPKTAKLYLDAAFTNSEILGYEYDSISAKGELASEFFNGQLNVRDPNCKISTSGQVDLSEKPEQINALTSIQHVDFQKLGFFDDVLSLSGIIEADITGLNFDSLQGDLKIIDLNAYWKKDSIDLDSVYISSYKRGLDRRIQVELPDIEVDINGNFYFSQLVSDVKLLSREVSNYFDPNYSSADNIYRVEEEINKYSVDFEISYDDVTRYTNLFNLDAYFSPKGIIEGTYYQRRNATLSLFTEIDSINYEGVGYRNNTVDINFSKDLDSAGIIASAFINSAKQTWRKIPQTRNFSLEAVWFNNKINLNSSIEQPENNSSANINGELKIQKDQLVFNFTPSKMIIFGDQWFFNPFNKITLRENNHLYIDRLELYQNAESILLSGTYSDSANTDLSLNIKDFNLHNIGPLISYDLEGVLNSTVDLRRSVVGEPFVLDSELKLDDFTMNDFLIGTVKGKSQWDQEKKRLAIDYNVRREGVNTIDIDGFYSPEESDQLDINAKFNQASLQLANPFLASLFSNIGGYASGEVDISGSLTQPIVIGSTDVDDGTFKFDYLGTTYGFNGNIALDNKSIKFNGVRLVDRDQNRASFSGVIQHQFFKEFRMDLSLAVSNFQLLNTSAEENSLYYGTANATGDIDIVGPVDDLLIRAKATTNKGTKLYIPLSGASEEVTQKEYISFVDFSDTTQQIDVEEIVRNSISGVSLDFEVDVTPDAYVELIFDIRTGDIIRGRGNGNLNLALDTNGEFELFGDLTISEGAYNFTIPNFINKEFTIVPGSTISWYGDPYAGILNLSASYRQLASPLDYFQSAGEEDQTVKQKYPVLVVVNLTGDMLSPNIDFKIQLEDSQSSPTADVEKAVSEINSNEQELKRQVFSLLILRKISPQTGFDLGAGAVQGSLSEFFSNQFSYFISQVDENLEVDVDLSSLDQNAFNTFQLRLSYTFLDGRLRVSGGGGLPQEGEDASTSSYIGDWSIRYLLTADGHLRVKAFSQTEQLASAFIRETGVSFQYLKSFNDFRDLVTKSREASIATKPKDVSKEIEANRSQKPPEN